MPATRSTGNIENEVPVTWPPITPDAIPVESVVSTLVEMKMPVSLPGLATPTVKPISVTVTAVLAASTAVPPVVMTMKVPPGCAGVRVAPGIESVAVGGVVALTKKPDG